MAYIGKSIESGTFSVLDTSGNTYNGSNVTFSLGTQVGSPAQLLVSHDGVIQKPGTDYSLATGGTQITFSTAPASGASIFIVEISGAVGGPLDSDLNGTELILDADGDTSITADTDDQIDVKIAGADDFKFTANTFTANSGSSIVVPDGGLTFGSTAIASTAAELNILDGVTATAAELNILDGVTATAAELNIVDGNTSATSTTIADADRVVLNDNGTMVQAAMTDVKTYIGEGLFNKITSVNTSGSTTSLTVDNCFTSTYRNYFVTVEKLSIGASDSKLEWKFRTGGGSGSDQGNNLGGASQGWLGGSNSEMTQQKVNGGAVPLTNNLYQDDDMALQMWVFNPQANNERSIISGRAVYREGSTSYVGFNDFGFLSISTETHTGFKLQTTSSQWNAGGRVTVYGITNPS